MNEMFEDDSAQVNEYSADEFRTAPTPSVGNYPTLKAVAQLATKQPQSMDAESFYNIVDRHYDVVASENNASDAQLAEKYASQGYISGVEAAVSSVAARMELQKQVSTSMAEGTRAKLMELSQAAADNVSTQSYAVVINNAPEKVAAVADASAKQVAASSSLEKEMEDATDLLSTAGGLAFEFTPMAMLEGVALDEIAVKYGVAKDELNWRTGRNKAITLMQLKFQSLPEEERDAWLTNVFKDAKNSWRISDWQAALFAGAIASGEEQTWEGWEDWLNRVGVAGTVLSGGMAILKAGKLFKAGKGLANIERTIAATGGKESILAAEAAKVASKTAYKEGIQTIAGEVTGASAILDLGKLVSMTASKVLPDSLTVASAELQKVIKQPVEQLIADLKEVVAGKGIKADEAAQTLKAIENSYSPAIDNTIHTVHPFSLSDTGTITGKVWYKPADASAFLTKEAAENAAKLRDPTGVMGLKVVPDTTNTNFLVEESVVQTLQMRKAAAEAQLLELLNAEGTAKKGSKRASKAVKTEGEGVGSVEEVKAPVAAPKSLSTSKPSYASGSFKIAGKDLGWKSQLDKAIYQLTNKDKISGNISMSGKSDPEVLAWVKSQGLSETDIVAAGKQIREHLKNAVKNPDVASTGAYTVPTQIVPAKASAMGRGTITISGKISEESITSIFKNASMTRVGNVSLQEGVHGRVGDFVSRLGARLGMGDHRIVVLQESSLMKSKDPALKEVASYMKTKKNVGAIYYPTKEGTMIIMRVEPLGSVNSFKKYMEVFAHEYGHTFERVFQTSYPTTFAKLYDDWLAAKGIKNAGSGVNKFIKDAFPLEAMLEWRALSNADEMSVFVDNWFNGNKAAYLEQEKAMHKWASSYQEFFAEQFAKWAYTDEVPTTILGQAFTQIVNGFKYIASQLRSVLQAHGVVFTATADSGVVDFLRQHIKYIDEGMKADDITFAQLALESKTMKPSAEALSKEIADIDEQLKAIDAAKGGLVHGYLIQKDVSQSLTYSSIGKYTDEDINSATRFSMGDWALKTSSELYAGRVVGVNQQGRYLKLLTEFVRPSIEKLGHAERVALDNLLVLGDKQNKVFSEAEMLGMDASKRTREAYYKVRALRDVMYHMRNDAAAKSLTRQGYVRISSPDIVLDPDAGNLFGKLTEPVDGTRVYDPITNKLESYNATTFKSKGLRVYTFEEPVVINGRPRKSVAVRESTLTTSTITEVVPYRVGEYRRVYSDEYFVKLSGEMDVDGAPEIVKQAHRTAASAKEAHAYAAAFNRVVELHAAGKLTTIEAANIMQPYGWKVEDIVAELDSGRLGKGVRAEVFYNRTDDDFIKMTTSVGNSWASKRGQQLPNVYGELSNTLSPLDSIASEIGNTSYVASISEWRESNIIRWYNTFAEHLPINVQRMEPDKAFAYMLQNKGAYVGQTKQLSVAESVQDYIVAQMNIPTAEERAFVGRMRQFSEMVEGVSGDGLLSKAVHKFGMGLRASSDYPKWARTVSFHSFFGFNPVQLMVQGMNAFNAVAISPIHGAIAGKSMPFYRLALMSDNEAVWRKFAAANKITNMGLGSADEFVETVRAIRRSGLLDGINSTSLYGAETGKFGLFNGITRKAGETSSFFFNRGEEAARLISFDIAKREFISKNPGTAWWTDDNLAKIMERQDDLTQNMTTANVATWQKGWKSIPTQFVQYQVKLMMNVIQSLLGNNRAFTRPEAIRLLVAHGLMMGTAGYMLTPLREVIGNAISENVESDEARLYLQQGAIAGIIGSLTDGETRLGIGSRFNTFRFYEDLVDGILDPEKSFLEVMSGASGGAIVNILGGVGNLVSLMSKSELSEETLKIGLTELAVSSSSAVNNVYKSWLATNNFNYVMSKNKGTRQYEVSDSEAFLMAVGIPPAKAEDFETLYRSKKSHADGIKSAANELAKRSMLAGTALRNKDEDSYKVHAAVIQNILAGYTGADLQTLMRSAYNTEEGSQFNKMIVEQAMKDFPIDDALVNKKLGDY